MLYKEQLSSSSIGNYRAWGRGGVLEKESRKGEGLARDFRRQRRNIPFCSGPASGNSWCAGDPCWLRTSLPGRREGAAGLCGSQRGWSKTLRFVSVSLYSGVGACSTTCDYMWAPLGDGSNVTEHKSHKVQALNSWLPLREFRLERGRSLSPTDASLTSCQCMNPLAEALRASK